MTNNEDSTICVDNVHSPSGRVFKGLYLPLCQIMALKVTSRLDNDNVKQILGEFKQQLEVLSDCDELMRIHGRYRNLSTAPASTSATSTARRIRRPTSVWLKTGHNQLHFIVC